MKWFESFTQGKVSSVTNSARIYARQYKGPRERPSNQEIVCQLQTASLRRVFNKSIPPAHPYAGAGTYFAVSACRIEKAVDKTVGKRQGGRCWSNGSEKGEQWFPILFDGVE